MWRETDGSSSSSASPERHMSVFKGILDFMTLGSDRPIRRLVAYYAVLGAALASLIVLFPSTGRVLLGSGYDATSGSSLLRDGLTSGQAPTSILQAGTLLELAVTTTLCLVGTIALMLPVSWVYMSARQVRGHSQAIVQTLIILPIVVAGIVLIVRNSLALAFSLAGVVAAVRFRTTLRDARDVVFVFLAIAVGFAAGVQTLAVGALLSVIFNLVLLMSWRYDFGRNVLEPTASSMWTEPLKNLASSNGHNGHNGVPDRDLMLALTPKKIDALAERFGRVRDVVGPNRKKPRFNAVLSVTTDKVGETQVIVQKVLDKMTKRWILDEAVSNSGKPSEIYYMVRLGKSMTREELLTAMRAKAGDRILSADLEIGEAIEREKVEREKQIA
jgi:hypothetical protein